MNVSATKENVLYVFQRVEKKYIFNEDKGTRLMERIAPYIQAGSFETATICNIYYDTQDDLLIRRSLEKPVYKEKLRLRSYGIPQKGDPVYLEIKKKFDGVVYKRRVALSIQEATDYLNHGIRPTRENQILKELDYFLSFYDPIPKLFLAYERTAYESRGEDGLRITLDRNIRSRKDDLFLDLDDHGVPLLQPRQCLMEIKVPQNMPLWLVHALSDLEIYPTSFSKYGKVYAQEVISCSTAS